MGAFWSQFYLVINGIKHTDEKVTYHTIPSLVGRTVNFAYKDLASWFEDYKIISITNVGYVDVALERKKMIVIHYNPNNNLVTKIEIYE